MKRIFDRDLWAEVYSTLTNNLLRTALTTLGVLFAIITLILLLGVTNGLINRFNKNFEGTSTNSIFVWGNSTEKPYKGFERGRQIKLTFDDVKLLENKINEIELLSPRVLLSSVSNLNSVSRNGKSSNNLSVYGDYPSIDKIAKKTLKVGRFLNQNDIENRRKVAVLEDEVYKRLFEKDENPIGEYICINGVYFQVVGVFNASKGYGIDQRIISIPFTTFKKVFNSNNLVSWMAIVIKPEYKAGGALNKINKLLKDKHKAHPKDTRAIGSFNLSEIFEGVTAFSLVLKFFSFFIGIFTLLAGVIAISNILLITVKERTKEIGIRRALGATPKIIKTQIIFESLILTIFSGLLGFVISIGILHNVELQNSGSDSALLNPNVSFPQLIGTFILMIVLSLIVGLIPANRATKIRPIEALREE